MKSTTVRYCGYGVISGFWAYIYKYDVLESGQISQQIHIYEIMDSFIQSIELTRSIQTTQKCNNQFISIKTSASSYRIAVFFVICLPLCSIFGGIKVRRHFQELFLIVVRTNKPTCNAGSKTIGNKFLERFGFKEDLATSHAKVFSLAINWIYR